MSWSFIATYGVGIQGWEAGLGDRERVANHHAVKQWQHLRERRSCDTRFPVDLLAITLLLIFLAIENRTPKRICHPTQHKAALLPLLRYILKIQGTPNP
jgi:hypothetical protein